jgi:hypothetical protein
VPPAEVLRTFDVFAPGFRPSGPRRSRGLVHPGRRSSPPRARGAEVRYPSAVTKVLREILKLLWKAFRLVLWKWLKPLLGRIFLYAILLIGVVLLVVMIAARV